MKKLKKITCMLLVFGLVMISGALCACNIFKDEPNNDNEMLFLEGTSIVMSLTEAETLLSQAKSGASGASLLSASLTPAQYSKADLLLIINQIKENMINSTVVSCYYTYDTNSDWDKGVIGNNLEYGYCVEGDNIFETWTVKEPGQASNEFTDYRIITKNGQTSYEKRTVYSDEGINIEQFCKGKFLFMVSDLDFNESHIEGGYVHNNNLYIKLSVDEMDGEINSKESFVVEDGRIIKDKLSWIDVDGNSESYFGVTQNYAWDEDADATLLERARNIPQNVTWQED